MRAYAVTTFISAFLLFQLQPLIGKFLLPQYGGTPAVWTTCMLFFQLMLLAGYSYAHWMASRFQLRHQSLVHASLLALSIFLLPIIPDTGGQVSADIHPTWQILTQLLFTIGILISDN